VTFVVLLVERIFVRGRSFAPNRGHEGQSVISLRSGKTALLASVTIVAFLAIVFPLGVLILRGASAEALNAAISRGGASLGRSIAYAAAGATGLVLVGFLCGYAIQTRALRLWRSLDFLTIFLFALPGPVIAIGLISLWNRKATGFVYATPLIIILGYLAQYTALTTRMSASALDHVPQSMEEAAQVSGAHWGRRLLRIVLPLVHKGLVAAWLVGYLFCLRDTGITMLVYPPGHDTLPVRTFTLMANGRPELIAALCLLMVASAVVPLLILAVTFRRAGRVA
jgi:iron(III) transport system permease protein